MKKVGYSKTFPILTSGQWEKIWIEDEVTGSEEDARKMLYSLKKQVENFHYESNKADEKKAEVKINFYTPSSVDNGDRNDGNLTLSEQIMSCKELKVLDSYKFIVKGKPELEEVYNQKLKELT